MMIVSRRSLFSSAILGVGLFAGAVVYAQGAGVWLVNSQEAGLPPSATSNAGRSITRGPAIRQLSPEKAVSANKPFDLHVEFAGRGGEKINPTSAQIVVLRGGNINITDRVKPFITANGIEMPAAMVPPGLYVLQVQVSDASGRQSTANVEIDAH
jgi:hypothetical protein